MRILDIREQGQSDHIVGRFGELFENVYDLLLCLFKRVKDGVGQLLAHLFEKPLDRVEFGASGGQVSQCDGGIFGQHALVCRGPVSNQQGFADGLVLSRLVLVELLDEQAEALLVH